jgi:hypothetical protein
LASVGSVVDAQRIQNRLFWFRRCSLRAMRSLISKIPERQVVLAWHAASSGRPLFHHSESFVRTEQLSASSLHIPKISQFDSFHISDPIDKSCGVSWFCHLRVSKLFWDGSVSKWINSGRSYVTIAMSTKRSYRGTVVWSVGRMEHGYGHRRKQEIGAKPRARCASAGSLTGDPQLSKPSRKHRRPMCTRGSCCVLDACFGLA